jgi:hypothetical protein
MRSSPSLDLAMPAALRGLFPPNTRRRLLAKAAAATLRHPIRLVRLAMGGGAAGVIRLLRDREHALLEDLLRFALGAGTAAGRLGGERATGERPAPHRPAAGICLGVRVDADLLAGLGATLDSLRQQSHRPARVLLLAGKGVSVEDLRAALGDREDGDPPEIDALPLADAGRAWSAGDYAGFLDAGDVLAPGALLAMMTHGAKGARPADLVYGDEVVRLPGGRTRPIFKPDWSPELLLGRNYVGRFFLVDSRRAAMLGGFARGLDAAGLYDLLLRVTDAGARVVHVAEPLSWSDAGRGSDDAAMALAAADALVRRRWPGEVVPLPSRLGWRVQPGVQGSPRVSIIVPTALRNPGMLHACLRAIRDRSSYRNLETLLVDNRTPAAPLPADLAALASRHVAFPEPFNFSRMNNVAAARATGEYLLFLNDDTEVLSPDWIEAMLAWAQMPEIGVVGAHLLYPDGSTQHGGIFWLDDASGIRHAFRHLRRPENSAGGLLGTVRDCSAVTFACALVPRRVWDRLGGLDSNLRVECNDVDFCLRARGAGYRVVWTPFARLRHHELATRQVTHVPEDLAFYRHRWGEQLRRGDPFFNPNLSQESDFFLPRPGAACREPGA